MGIRVYYKAPNAEGEVQPKISVTCVWKGHKKERACGRWKGQLSEGPRGLQVGPGGGQPFELLEQQVLSPS